MGLANCYVTVLRKDDYFYGTNVDYKLVCFGHGHQIEIFIDKYGTHFTATDTGNYSCVFTRVVSGGETW